MRVGRFLCYSEKKRRYKMKVKKEVTLESVTYWIWGTEDEIKMYFRNTPIIPAKAITILTCQTKEEWYRQTKDRQY